MIVWEYIMAKVDGTLDYLSWSDVRETTKYLEQGYGGRILLQMVVACPKGEQYDKCYYEYLWCDDKLQPRAMPQRVLGRFPNAGSKTVPAMLYGMLLTLDAILSNHAVWAEPKLVGKPTRWDRT